MVVQVDVRMFRIDEVVAQEPIDRYIPIISGCFLQDKCMSVLDDDVLLIEEYYCNFTTIQKEETRAAKANVWKTRMVNHREIASGLRLFDRG